MKIAITGADGLLGWHTAARLHAANCAARYRGDAEPYTLVLINRALAGGSARYAEALRGVEVVIHFAGVNRGEDGAVAVGNPTIANDLIKACQTADAAPHIVYANSVHACGETVYGRSKRAAGEILRDFAGYRFTDLVLPHIFGECARPRYNNVTATLIEALWRGDQPEINRQGSVELLHAGAAAQLAIDAGTRGTCGSIAPPGRTLSVAELFERLQALHTLYQCDIFPSFDEPFDLQLFNCYRTAGFPSHYPRALELRADQRGALFESAKSQGGGQSFLSTTLNGQKRGDHFHTDLVERFLVVSGEAVIRVRKVLSDEVYTFTVNGSVPAAIDMPPYHTHHIENIGDGPLITFFWAHRIFDPAVPDTFADPVL